MLDWRIATVIAVLVSRDWKLEWSLSSGPWEVQTSTRAGLGFRAGVKDYRLTYFMDDYKVIDTDLLAAFRAWSTT